MAIYSISNADWSDRAFSIFHSLLNKVIRLYGVSEEAIAILFYSGVMASAVAYTLWSYLLGSGEGGKASISLLLVPVIGIISGSIFFRRKTSLYLDDWYTFHHSSPCFS